MFFCFQLWQCNSRQENIAYSQHHTSMPHTPKTRSRFHSPTLSWQPCYMRLTSLECPCPSFKVDPTWRICLTEGNCMMPPTTRAKRTPSLHDFAITVQGPGSGELPTQLHQQTSGKALPPQSFAPLPLMHSSLTVVLPSGRASAYVRSAYPYPPMPNETLLPHSPETPQFFLPFFPRPDIFRVAREEILAYH